MRPLIIKGPTVASGVVSRTIHSVEVFDMIAEHLGIPDRVIAGITPLRRNGGLPVVAEWYASVNSELLSPELGERFNRDLWAIWSETLKLYMDEYGNLELYHLKVDPEETKNLAERRSADVLRMNQRLTQWLRQTPRASYSPAETPSRQIRPEEQRALQSLGYIK